MQDVHYQTKHPRGSSPNQETDQAVGDRVGRLRSIEQTPEDLLTTLNELNGQQLVGQLAEPTTKLTAQVSSSEWHWDGAGRWV
jgi:hypothetical protein